MHAADSLGRRVLLIVDGLDDCSAAVQSELLGQLNAIRYRYPVAVAISSKSDVRLPATTPAIRLELLTPNHNQRLKLLAAYGASALEPLTDIFNTPMDLSLLATCSEDLPARPTRSELYDAYLRHRSGSVRVRAGLRRIAAIMDERVRATLTIPEVIAALERGGQPNFEPAVIDEVLASVLLTVRQGRVSFQHEQLGRFLAAEQLVVKVSEAAALAQSLSEPQRQDLASFAIGLELDMDRQYDVLSALADPELLNAAARGQFGDAVAVRVQGAVYQVLVEALLATESAVVTPDNPEAWPDARWQIASARSPLDQALLIVAGRCLNDGLFTTEVVELMYATDARLLREVQRLARAGHRMPISTLLPDALGIFQHSGEDGARGLAACVVLGACRDDFRRLFRRDEDTAGVAKALWEATQDGRERRWALLNLILQLASPQDVHIVPDLFAAAWAAGGYHLRLEALDCARRVAGVADEEIKCSMLDVLNGIEISNAHLFLQSLFIETLAAYDGIEPARTLAAIHDELEEVLSRPDDPDAQRRAYHLFSAQFEDESVLGPYSEAIGELEQERYYQFCLMAAQQIPPYSICGDILLRTLGEKLSPHNRLAVEAVRRYATSIDLDSPVMHEAVAVHMEALYAWSTISDQLPQPSQSDDPGPAARAWRLVDSLLLAAFIRHTEPVVHEAIWDELKTIPTVTAEVFYHLARCRLAGMMSSNPPVLAHIREAFPNQLRELLLIALTRRHHAEPVISRGIFSLTERDRFIIDALGQVGDAEVAAVLRRYLTEAELGRSAVTAIRAIEARQNQGDIESSRPASPG
jgi:hypothetical protein